MKRSRPLFRHYTNIAKCYEALGDLDQAKQQHDLALASVSQPSDSGPFYHGTRAGLKVGDLLTAGYASNYQPELVMSHIYFTALVNGAGRRLL
nr:NAD(+)--rifampin ADP-ribosyltransferase [Mucilaginibacter humi]